MNNICIDHLNFNIYKSFPIYIINYNINFKWIEFLKNDKLIFCKLYYFQYFVFFFFYNICEVQNNLPYLK